MPTTYRAVALSLVFLLSLAPSVVATVIWTGCSTPCRAARLLDQPHCPLDRDLGVVLQPEAERQVEEELGVGRPLDQREEGRVDLEREQPEESTKGMAPPARRTSVRSS